MLRYGVLLAALVTSLLGAFVLYRTGWFAARPAPAHPAAHVRSVDAPNVPTVVRFRQAQMKHWRALLLQH
jgi:hypothetical protein